ncbi:MAG: chemotaxis protein CheB [bacterium]
MARKKQDRAKKAAQPEPITAEALAAVTAAETATVTAAAAPAGFPVVGIGASAGGLAAFEAFFSALPADSDPGMAFVLVQHLAPDHKSILADLVKRYTRMEVFEVQDGMRVRPNCAYIIPPNCDMAFLNGGLQLLEPAAPRGQRLPIDFFFRSLAQDQHERAICIVLSGTGSDGTLGLRAIKGEGGMAMAQTLESTEYDGMPRSAIATGLVDFVLPPAEMPAHLIAYATHAFGKLPRTTSILPTKAENTLKRIFVLVRAQTGHDFSLYKSNTINRRIERRMAVHQIESLDGYVRYLQQTPAEVDALFRDFLIGVTSFFRNPDAFAVLEKQVIPQLFSGKVVGSVMRVWAPGCSTGEEAYSIAMLIQEHMEAIKRSFKVQIFATDIDSQAIAVARAGLYPASVATDISPERLNRFFAQEPDGSAYRVHKAVRDMLVFSDQDVIKDPPFSKLDLISCRNLLIYMGEKLQKKIIPLFHYALNPGGFLFLGTSETVGAFTELFSPLDRKLKLYQRREDIHGTQHAGMGKFLPLPADGGPVFWGAGKARGEGTIRTREVTERALLQHCAPVGTLVNGHGDILYLHGRTGMYLEPAPGETGTSNILKMAREGLRRDLTTALQKASVAKGAVRCPRLRVKTNGDFTTVDLTIQPVAADPDGPAAPPLFLIVFEESAPLPPPEKARPEGPDPATVDAATGEPEDTADADARIATLTQELRAKDEYLQTTNEELETSNEELKSSNEEMQSVNEEMQSTNEELETAKEELQSTNEELATVNSELQTKVTDLSRANNDMNNLLAGSGIGTIFVDRQLRIMRFTPAVTQVINLILSDVGRPVSHIVSNLAGYDRLVADTQSVLDSLIPKEIEVRTEAGAWYLMRIQPYRTLEHVIDGAVITFVNITEMKKAEEALRESEERFKKLFVEAPLGIALIDSLTGHIYEVNPMFAKIAGRTMEEMVRIDWMSITHPDDVQEDLDNMARLNAGEIDGFQIEKRYLHHDGATVWINMTIAQVKIEDRAHPRHLCMIKDITERKQVEAALRESRERYSTIFNQSPIAIEFYNSDGGLISVNDACIDLFGVVDRNEISGFKLFEDPNISGDIKTKLLNGENVRFEAEFNFEEVKKLNLYQTTCSGIKILDWSISPLTNGTLVIGYIEQIQDITERKQAEEALRKANEQIRLAVAVRDARDAIATTEQAADPDAEGTSQILKSRETI